MTDTPLVSVVTPTFNRAGYLRTAIESVQAQTYPHFEMNIVDDGSTDDTAAVVEEYLGDPRIRYHRQSNHGQSVARNVGIEHSRGDFICFLDSDNAWLPSKLEESISAFNENPWAGVVYGNCISIDGSGSEISRNNMARYSGNITARLLRDNFVSMNTTMSRAEHIRAAGGFEVKDRLAEDYGLWLRVSALAQFHHVPAYWAYYRIMDDQLSSQKLERLDANEQVLTEFLRAHGDALTQREIRDGWCAFYVRKARHQSMEGQTAAALGTLRKAIRLAPASRAPWRALARIGRDALGVISR